MGLLSRFRKPRPATQADLDRIERKIERQLMDAAVTQRFDGTLVVDPSKVYVPEREWPRIKRQLEQIAAHQARKSASD